MSTARQLNLEWIDRDRDELVHFLQAFVQHKSPNPSGDIRDVASFVRKFLDLRELPYRIISPTA